MYFKDNFDSIDPFDPLELYKKIPKSDFKLDKVKWEDIEKEMKKYPLRNAQITSIRPDYAWAVNDVCTVEESIEAFNKMSKQEQGFFLAMFETSMAMQGIMPVREDNELRRLYYSQGKKNDDSK